MSSGKAVTFLALISMKMLLAALILFLSGSEDRGKLRYQYGDCGVQLGWCPFRPILRLFHRELPQYMF